MSWSPATSTVHESRTSTDRKREDFREAERVRHGILHCLPRAYAPAPWCGTSPTRKSAISRSLGNAIIEHDPMKLMPGVLEALEHLAGHNRLFLLTKGEDRRAASEARALRAGALFRARRSRSWKKTSRRTGG